MGFTEVVAGAFKFLLFMCGFLFLMVLVLYASHVRKGRSPDRKTPDAPPRDTPKNG